MTQRPTISVEDPDQPDVLAMLAEADALFAGLYPAERNYLLDADTLTQPGTTFYVARSAGRPVGCGALVRRDGFGEIKRMFVDETARGLGIGGRLLAHIERAAADIDIGCLRLETGIYQPEAISLYRSRGFRNIGPFADYAPSEVSLFMEKRL